MPRPSKWYGDRSNSRKPRDILLNDMDVLEKTTAEASNDVQLPERCELSQLRDRIRELVGALDARQKEATTKLCATCRLQSLSAKPKSAFVGQKTLQ